MSRSDSLGAPTCFLRWDGMLRNKVLQRLKAMVVEYMCVDEGALLYLVTGGE